MASAGQLTWQQLVAIARRVGVKVVEAPSSHRGKLGKMGSVVGITEHTTGTPNTYAPANDYPDYNVVKEGRPGLENSLSAYGIGRRDSIYVFSEFLSWHAGAWSWLGVTDGNGHFLGIECAGVGDYTEFQRRVYPRLVAAILLEIRQDRRWACRHLDGAVPKGRKVDAQNLVGNFYQGRSFDQWVDFFLANPAFININYAAPSEDDMPTPDELFAAPLFTDNFGTPQQRTIRLRDFFSELRANAATAAAAQGQIAGLTEALRQLAASSGQAIDLAAVEAAAERGVAKGIEAIDVVVRPAGS